MTSETAMFTEMLFAAARNRQSNTRIDTLVELIKKLEQRIDRMERHIASIEATLHRSKSPSRR